MFAKSTGYSALILFFICILLLSCLSANVLAADETTGDQSGKQPKVITIEDVVVRGEVVNKDLEATSATILTNEDTTNRVFITPLDIVTLSPGVTIHQYKQGGTAANFMMRGFTGNSHGSNTAIFLDGIPLNEGDGYADTNIINPDEIERVELIKGPSSALYGNYASAGSLAFYTKKRVDNNHINLNYGSHHTYEANFVGGLSNEGWDQVYSITRTDITWMMPIYTKATAGIGWTPSCPIGSEPMPNTCSRWISST